MFIRHLWTPHPAPPSCCHYLSKKHLIAWQIHRRHVYRRVGCLHAATHGRQGVSDQCMYRQLHTLRLITSGIGNQSLCVNSWFKNQEVNLYNRSEAKSFNRPVTRHWYPQWQNHILLSHSILRGLKSDWTFLISLWRTVWRWRSLKGSLTHRGWLNQHDYQIQWCFEILYFMISIQ